jgi:hypothetical protein
LFRIAAVLALLLACAACGSVPQPFRDAPRATSDNPLLDVPSAVGIAILPVTGAPAPLNREIPKALATRLQALDIPAEAVDSNAGLGFTLSGAVQDVVTSPAGITATIVWNLRSRRGSAGDYRQSIAAPASAWRDDATDVDGRVDAASVKGLATQLAGAAGASIVAMVSGDAPTATTPARARMPRIAIAPVEGAPGDGRESLRLALIQVMFERGVARDETNPEVTLRAVMTSEPLPGDQQKVAIVWHAIGRDGKDLGTVRLDNTIPNGALDGPWGPTAFAIATAAAPDLVSLLGTAAILP